MKYILPKTSIHYIHGTPKKQSINHKTLFNAITPYTYDNKELSIYILNVYCKGRNPLSGNMKIHIYRSPSQVGRIGELNSNI